MRANRTMAFLLAASAGAAVIAGIASFTGAPGWLRASSSKSAAASAAPTSGPSIPAAADGESLYRSNCMACHAADGHGSAKYPDIAGEKFKRKYGSLDKAYAFISTNMPENAPGSLQDDEYKAIVRYVLGLNGIPTAFTDIAGHWASTSILSLQEKGYVDGYVEQGQLLYKPDRNITREEFVTYLVKAKELFLSNEKTSSLTDLGKSKNKTYLVTAVEYGLVDGYPDGTFRPDKPISRAEIAAVLARSEALSVPEAGSAGAKFKDVNAAFWALGPIEAAAEAGLFNGYEDGTFRPANNITRAEAAAVLDRLVLGVGE